MKTAMQLMLEDLELRYKALYNAQMIQACGAIEGTIEYAKSLILKEKEQIKDAYHKGGYLLTKKPYGVFVKEVEEYYNQIYNL